MGGNPRAQPAGGEDESLEEQDEEEEETSNFADEDEEMGPPVTPASQGPQFPMGGGNTLSGTGPTRPSPSPYVFPSFFPLLFTALT